MKKVKLKLELQYNSPVILTFFLLSLLVLFLDQWTVLGETSDLLDNVYPLVSTQYSPMLWPG